MLAVTAMAARVDGQNSSVRTVHREGKCGRHGDVHRVENAFSVHQWPGVEGVVRWQRDAEAVLERDTVEHVGQRAATSLVGLDVHDPHLRAAGTHLRRVGKNQQVQRKCW